MLKDNEKLSRRMQPRDYNIILQILLFEMKSVLVRNDRKSEARKYKKM